MYLLSIEPFVGIEPQVGLEKLKNRFFGTIRTWIETKKLWLEQRKFVLFNDTLIGSNKIDENLKSRADLWIQTVYMNKMLWWEWKKTVVERKFMGNVRGCIFLTLTKAKNNKIV